MNIEKYKNRIFITAEHAEKQREEPKKPEDIKYRTRIPRIKRITRMNNNTLPLNTLNSLRKYLIIYIFQCFQCLQWLNKDLWFIREIRPIRVIRILVFLCGFEVFVLSGCATIYNPATGRQEFILIDTGLEVALGQNVARSVARKYKIIEDHSISQRVQSIGDRLAKVSDRQNLPYRFYVIEQDNVNAFAAPGGYIFVHKGLLDKIGSDDELAGVLAHEVGHIAARHSVKHLQAALGYDILASIAFRGGSSKDVERAANITFDLIQRGYSRQDELEADRLAVRYSHKAGFNPKVMITFLKKLQELEKYKPLQVEIFLRTHPFIPQRIETIEEEIKKLK